MTPRHPPVSLRACAQLVAWRRPLPNAEALAQKAALLDTLAAAGPAARRWKPLAALHDALLCMRAFPDSIEAHALAGRGLLKVDSVLRRLPARERAKGDDTGVSGTTSRHTFEYAIARWITQRFPDALEIDWAALDGTDRIDALLRPQLARAEEDAFDGGLLSTREWLGLARSGGVAPGCERAIHWMLESVSATRAAERVVARLYDAAPLPLAWKLAGSVGSVTRNQLSVAAPAIRTSMRRQPARAVRAIVEPLPGIVRLGRPLAGAVIDAARAALAARCREVFAISNANIDEVWLAPLGEGVGLALIGVAPRDRLSLEANYGYLLMSNGVPIGYGGITALYGQANTGINIFDPFRGTEAGFLWTAMLRAFRTLFGVTRFVVNAIQFGEDNEEAIASGAYWFYWRLGFRPIDPARKREATAEAARLATPSARSSPRTLRHLAVGDLVLTLPGATRGGFFDERWLTTCAMLVTRRLTAEHPHAHDRAVEAMAERVARQLGAHPDRWPLHERTAFHRLAPVVSLLEQLPRWSKVDRRALVALMRAKGRAQERDFVQAAAAHPRFHPELIARCRRG